MSNTKKKTKAGKIDYARTVIDLQEKLSRAVQVQISSSQQPDESKQCIKEDSNKHCNVATDSASSTSWQSKSGLSKSAQYLHFKKTTLQKKRDR